MRLGTRSVLYGAHCFFIHPYFVAKAWTQLYGFPTDPRLWVAFYVHDLGYIGKAEMDDEAGERHPELGARIMWRLFGEEWGRFVLFHSRFLAKRYRAPFSRLCVADKLAIAITPAWLYLPAVTLTGEVEEYMATYGIRSISREPNLIPLEIKDKQEWYRKLQDYMFHWVQEHRDGRPDTWTNRSPV